MQDDKSLGTILIVVGGAIGLWVFTRFTSFAGKLHTWSPPFEQYELITLAGAGVALLLIIIGIRKLSQKRAE